MPPSMDAPNETTTADRRRSPVVSIISPTYNEALNVGPLIDGLHAALVDVAHEVIIVDDDSPDGTWEIVEALAATDDRVRVIRRFGESGLSSAVLAGMEVATGSVLAVIDADGQHDEAALPEMVRRIEHGEADVVVGTRGAEGGSYGEFSLGRRIVSGVAAAHGLAAYLGSAAPSPGGSVEIDLDAVNSLASELEGHPDNASATVFGGMTLSFTPDVVDPAARVTPTVTVRLPLHPDLTAIVFVPEATLATHTARALLPERIPLRDAALNSARAALLVEAATRRPELLVPATRDWLHQEARRPSYAASMALVDRLRTAGHAATISGAGPSVLALTTHDRVDDVTAGDDSWRRLVPGIPAHGVTVSAR